MTEFGFPEINDAFLQGQDVFYKQFNDIEFYVEDIEQENFYFTVLGQLFPDLKFDKIFPLGGKPNILADAILNQEDRKKIYILDLDFDELLDRKVEYLNIFYLKKYSIENYLLQFEAISNVIIEERPKIRQEIITNSFDLNLFLIESHSLFSNLICYYLTIQRHSLGIVNVDNDTARFCDFTVMPAILRINQLEIYHSQIESALRNKNARLKLTAQLKQFAKYFRDPINSSNYIPGKYLLNFLKYRIEHLFQLPQMTLESFTFRLAKNCHFQDLLYLQEQVTNYINSEE